MPWAKARFKDQEILAEVDGSGALLVKRGRVAIRWSDKPGAKIYNGGATRIELLGGEVLEIDDEGAKPKSKGKSGGKGKGPAKLAKGDLPEGAAVGYTDGACSGNPGPAGSGVFLMLPDGRSVEAVRSLGRATNNIAELTALSMALELLDAAEVPPDAPVRLHTDSEYSIGVLAKGWKAKKNTELILGIREQFVKRPGVELAWVRGHAGHAGNERADELARMGSSGRTYTTWSDS